MSASISFNLDQILHNSTTKSGINHFNPAQLDGPPPLCSPIFKEDHNVGWFLTLAEPAAPPVTWQRRWIYFLEVKSDQWLMGFQPSFRLLFSGQRIHQIDDRCAVFMQRMLATIIFEPQRRVTKTVIDAVTSLHLVVCHPHGIRTA